jgi:hypothetical protein
MNSLQFIAETWPVQVRTSNDIVRSLWRELNRYAGRDAAERAYRRGHSDLTTIKSFRNCIDLADEYYAAYEDAAPSIDTVLIYYGTMWLGKAMIYVALPPGTKPGTAHGIQPKIDPGSKYPFLHSKLHVQQNDETFCLINRAFGGDEIAGKTFDLLDWLRALPELDADLRSILGAGTQALEVSSRGTFGGGTALTLADMVAPTGEMVYSVSPAQYCTDGYFRENVAAYQYLKAQNLRFLPSNGIAWDRQRFDSDEARSVLVTANRREYFAPKISGCYISEFALFTGIMHALCTLSRYFPDTWLEMLDAEGDEMFLIRQFLNIAEEKAPNLVVNHLSRESFILRSKLF